MTRRSDRSTSSSRACVPSAQFVALVALVALSVPGASLAADERAAGKAAAAGQAPTASAAAAPSASGEPDVAFVRDDEDRRLEAAHQRLVQAVAEAGEIVMRHPFYRDPLNRASGFAFLSSMLIAALEESVIQDPDFPLFRILDFRIREGGDNPDQRYAFTRIRGDATYRIWGRLGGERGLELQVYAGEPWRKGGGRSVSTLTFGDIRFDADGRFEIFLSPEKQGANWLANASDATDLIVRQVFSDWEKETPGEVHIDRVGFEGRTKPVATRAEMAARLERAAADLTRSVATWPDFVLHGYMASRPANTLSLPADPTAVGGVTGRYMSTGHFELAEDEALIVTLWPIDARYQGIQLADPWFSSLEYANRQTSLSADQAHRSRDGAYRFVVSSRDPGVKNWLDTAGLPRGAMLIRFDGSPLKSFPKAKAPAVEKVKLAEVRAKLPQDTPDFSPAARASAIAARRRHVQIRFGN
ncbi:MAG: DUF1214 domain-containing protein [Deltaproteobacteria bacterium]|nr:DUF1214 domain-containing protein [Deltaproteobacteria bacterium]